MRDTTSLVITNTYHRGGKITMNGLGMDSY
jgi:hypothetical protein